MATLNWISLTVISFFFYDILERQGKRMYIDTHLHLSKEDYDDIGKVIELANKNNVKKLIVSGCDKKGIKECLSFMDRYKDVYYTFGYHPSEVKQITNEDLIELEKIILDHKKIVGVGEIGLDYHYGKESRDQQIKLFQDQLELACRLKLPVVIHSRDATEDTIRILRNYPATGIIHCFSGSRETAEVYIKMGYKLGIGGVVTFSNSKLKDVIKEIPLHQIVLETDSPYLAPVPVRGSKNMPANIPYIAERLAEVKEVTVEEVEKMTTKSALEVFDLGIE